MRTLLTSILFASLAAGCADTRTSAGGLIVASEGGSVAADSHAITIPGGSLAADTEVTLSTAPASDYPALAGSLASVLLLEPEGTVLELPASVVIEDGFLGVGSEASVSVWQLSRVDGERWTPIESSRDAGSGDVTVSVTRFAPLAVTVTEAPSGSSIVGTLSWGDGTPVDGAPVQLAQGGSVLTTATTGADGSFTFADLTPGDYQLVVDYECMLEETVTVAAGPTEVDLTLCAF